MQVRVAVSSLLLAIDLVIEATRRVIIKGLTSDDLIFKLDCRYDCRKLGNDSNLTTAERQ
jgi:hypothetical protein